MRAPACFQWIAAVLASAHLAAAANGTDTLRGYASDPARFENDIRRFEEADAGNPPPADAVLCIGSSSMRGWHPWLAEDLTPLTVIPRGFGGSTMNDVLHYADRIVLPYRPRAILLYEGDNDAAEGVAPEIIHAAFTSLVAAVHRSLPDTRFYVLPAKPSPARWNLWPAMQDANARIRLACEADDRLTYIDIAPVMLLEDGRVDESLFVEDRLHMNRKGYEAWAVAVRDVLIPAEASNERP